MPLQLLDNNGRPIAGGCVFTYVSGTTTPLASYSDAAGMVLNSNPVILDSAGRARIFLTAAAYTLKLVTQGGVNCASGVTVWTIDGINPSANSVLGTNNTWTGTNDFTNATTFDGSAQFNVGLTSEGPNDLTGGGELTGTWTGSPIFSGTPNFTGGIMATTGTFSGQVTSTVTTGTPPFVIASTTEVPNLNVAELEGCTWEVPCHLGSTTPNAVDATVLNAHTSFELNGSTVQTGIQGTDTRLMTAGTVASGAGHSLCTDTAGGATTSGCNSSGFTQIEAVKKTSGNCTTTSSSYDSCTDSLTWPTAFADTNYVAVCGGLNTATAGDGSSNNATTLTTDTYSTSGLTVFTQTQRGATGTFTEIHCIGVHP
jgi:hypothetical protein